MNAMVQRGWSTYDCVMVYESNAVERLRQANGRWGPLRVIYPSCNFWNDHPYYVLNVPWSTPDQHRAANAFARFLLSEPAQREAMAHGFRPANLNVPTNGPDSPFVQFADVGLRVAVPGVFCEPPDADAIETLLLGWQRSQSGK
jgi:ABC-type sulfate transport system substrate-binding protein